MGYVIKDLEDDKEKKDANGVQSSPSATSIAGASKPQGVASAVQSQQTPQQQHGTGFTNLSEWLNAGAGRDKAITNVGAQKLGNEQGAFNKASSAAETGLAGQQVLSLSGTPQENLDLMAGVTPQRTPQATAAPPAAAVAPKLNSVQQPTTLAGVIKGGRTGSGLALTRPAAANPAPMQGNINTGGWGSSTSGPLATPQQVVGPNLDQVLNQSYKGPTGIDYKAGDDFQYAKMLGNTSTVADVLGKDSIEHGDYTQGMRALDAALYGSDGASQNAIRANAGNADAFQKDATAKGADFTARAQKRADEMSDAGGKLHTALEGIGNTTKSSLEKRAADANLKAQADSNNATMVRDPTTGNMVPIPKGQTLGGWEGAAVGSANAGNVMTNNENKRFAALNKLIGYDAPMKSGEYQEGRRTTKADASQIPKIADSWTDQQMKAAKAIMVREARQKANNKGMTPAAILGTIFGGGIPAAMMAGDAIGNGMSIERAKKQFADSNGRDLSPEEWAAIEDAVKKRWGVDSTGNVNGWNGP